MPGVNEGGSGTIADATGEIAIEGAGIAIAVSATLAAAETTASRAESVGLTIEVLGMTVTVTAVRVTESPLRIEIVGAIATEIRKGAATAIAAVIGSRNESAAHHAIETRRSGTVSADEIRIAMHRAQAAGIATTASRDGTATETIAGESETVSRAIERTARETGPMVMVGDVIETGIGIRVTASANPSERATGSPREIAKASDGGRKTSAGGSSSP